MAHRIALHFGGDVQPKILAQRDTRKSLGGNMNTLFGKVTRIMLILAVLVGAGTLLIAAGNSNQSSVASAPAPPLSPTKVGPQRATSVLMVYDTDSNGFG